MMFYEYIFSILFWKNKKKELSTDDLADAMRLIDAKDPFEEINPFSLIELSEEEKERLNDLIREDAAGKTRNYDVALSFAISGDVEKASTLMEILGEKDSKNEISPEIIQEKVKEKEKELRIKKYEIEEALDKLNKIRSKKS